MWQSLRYYINLILFTVYKAVVLKEQEDALTVNYDMRIELALKTGISPHSNHSM